MKNPLTFKLFSLALSRLVLLMPAIILLFISACMPNLPKTHDNQSVDKYSANNLAKDWREQVRKNPNNPYEGLNYPADNDSDYYAPKKRTVKNSGKPGYKQPSQNRGYGSAPAFEDNDDSSYGRFPRYNPDDDNVYTDSKNYPLYLD